MTDWTGKKTRVLPEYQNECPQRKDRTPRGEEVKNDQASSESGTARESPTVASPVPSLSASQASPMHNYVDLSLISSSGSQEAPVASPLESPSETRDEEQRQQHISEASALQRPEQSEAEPRSHSAVQAEAALLAHEITKLAKDICEQPPKKYRWEEWVNWLKVMGDEVGASNLKEMEPEKIQVSMSLPETDAQNLVEHPHHPYRRYQSQPNPHLKRKDGEGWDWTWLHDKGPLFSPQSETEWILLRLCSRLERLMSDDYSPSRT